MSIILDALKRSDRERRLQKPPDLSQIYHESHPPRKKVLVWILLIGVVFIAGLSGAYLLFQKDPGKENTKLSERAVVVVDKKSPSSGKQQTLRNFSKKPRKTDAVQKQKSSGIISQSRALPGSRRGRPRRHQDDQRTRETVQSDSEDAAGGNPLGAILAKATRVREEMATSNELDASRGAHPLASLFSGGDRYHNETTINEKTVPSPPKLKPPAPNPEINAPVPAKDQIASLSKPRGISIVDPEATQVEISEPVPENQAQEEAGEQDSVSVPSAPIKGNEPVVSEEKKIPLVDDLPYETRQKYEGLQINVHIYDDKSAERRVFINMHSYKEGEKIGEAGPVLVAIIPEGIIVDYGDGKIQMNVRK
jgi:cytoskeletal protein RodZ